MLELAYDNNGLPIQLPATGVARWLVRQHRAKTSPRVRYRDGLPLTCELSATVADLRQLLDNEPGHYRLLALDHNNVPIPGIPEAHVEIDDDQAPVAVATKPQLDTAQLLVAKNPTEALLLETMRANVALAQNIIGQLPEIMRSSAELLRAADGAGMPRRDPQWFDDYYDDDIEDAEVVNDAAPAWANTLMQLFGAGGLGALGGGLNLSSLLGAASSVVPPGLPTANRNAAATPASNAAPTTPTPASSPDGADSTPASPTSTAPPPTNHHGHLVAIHERLSPSERAYAERCLKSFSLPAVLAWRDTLLSMSVDDAVALIRARAQGTEV